MYGDYKQNYKRKFDRKSLVSSSSYKYKKRRISKPSKVLYNMYYRFVVLGIKKYKYNNMKNVWNIRTYTNS